jgi:hypothetical protein
MTKWRYEKSHHWVIDCDHTSAFGEAIIAEEVSEDVGPAIALVPDLITLLRDYPATLLHPGPHAPVEQVRVWEAWYGRVVDLLGKVGDWPGVPS